MGAVPFELDPAAFPACLSAIDDPPQRLFGDGDRRGGKDREHTNEMTKSRH